MRMIDYIRVMKHGCGELEYGNIRQSQKKVWDMEGCRD